MMHRMWMLAPCMVVNGTNSTTGKAIAHNINTCYKLRFEPPVASALQSGKVED